MRGTLAGWAGKAGGMGGGGGGWLPGTALPGVDHRIKGIEEALECVADVPGWEALGQLGSGKRKSIFCAHGPEVAKLPT